MKYSLAVFYVRLYHFFEMPAADQISFDRKEVPVKSEDGKNKM